MQPEKRILIGNNLIPYTGSDDQWTIETIERVYSIIFESLKIKEITRLEQEEKSEEEINKIRTMILPPFYWYPLNKLGYYGHSISKNKEVLDHQTGQILDTRNDPITGQRLSIYHSVLQIVKRPYSHDLYNRMFNKVIIPLPVNNNVKEKIKYNKGLNIPVTMWSKPYGFYENIPDITFLSLKDAENYLIEHAESYGLDDLASHMKLHASSNIIRACEAGPNPSSYAYNRIWTYAGQGNNTENRCFGELWQQICIPGIQYSEISNRGRIRICDSEKNFKVLKVGSGFVGPTGYKLCRLKKIGYEKDYIVREVDKLVVEAFYDQEFLDNIKAKKLITYHINNNKSDSDIYNLAFVSDDKSKELKLLSSTQKELYFRENFCNVQHLLLKLLEKRTSLSYYSYGKICPSDIAEYNYHLIKVKDTPYVWEWDYFTNPRYQYNHKLFLREAKYDKYGILIPREYNEKHYDNTGQRLKTKANNEREIKQRKEGSFINIKDEFERQKKRYDKKLNRRIIKQDEKEKRDLNDQRTQEKRSVEQIIADAFKRTE